MNENRIEHFGISVRDMEKSVQWYKDNFGFEEIRRFDKPDLAVKGVTLKLGDSFLELLQPHYPVNQEEKPTSRENSLKKLLQKTGSSHLALTVDDISSVYRKLKENKVKLITELLESRYFFCQDPDNILIEVRQKK